MERRIPVTNGPHGLTIRRGKRRSELDIVRAELEKVSSGISELQATLAEKDSKLREMELSRSALQSENHVLQAEISELRQLVEVLSNFTNKDAFDRILELQNNLTDAFALHMNANTKAINVMNAAIANLKVAE